MRADNTYADLVAQFEPNPGLCRRLMGKHTPDRQGRCLACRQYDAPWTSWPCSIYRVASDALSAHDESRTG